ncbi:CAP domain-containing protein [Candidatus Saccharibacteria bacterium]|nr:CAP domain-containing protein [Candidatus Saccharibacteria bacterium]
MAVKKQTKKPIKTKVTKRVKAVRAKTRRVAKKTFIPGEHNSYRPYLVRPYGLVVVLLIVVAVLSVDLINRDGGILGHRNQITQETLLADTNDYRTKHDESQLQLNSKLSVAAYNKATNMIDEGYWAHVSPEGVQPWKWINDQGYDYDEAGENLARGFNTSEDVVNAWVDSPAHRENMLNNDYTEVGFAAVSGKMDNKNTTVVVALYARPAAKGVLGVNDRAVSEAPIQDQSDNIWTHLHQGIRAATPSLLFVLVILGITTCVAMATHFYKNFWPKSMRKSWRRHRNLYKIAFCVLLALGAILAYGGGSI